jgi:Family of unknown function (DUF6461)
VAGATAADYAWFEDHWLREAFCLTLVRGLDEPELLARFGGERSRPRPLTLAEAAERSMSFQAGYPQLVLAARRGGWAVAVEANGWEGSRPEVLRAVSAGTRAVSVYRNVNALGFVSLADDGALAVQFEPLFPERRWGGRPDLLVDQMRAVGLDPDQARPLLGRADLAALALAERVTGVRIDPGLLDGPMTGVEVAPLLEDPPVSPDLAGRDPELAAAIDRATPDALRRAAATAAGQAVRLAGIDRDPVVAETLAAARAGRARPVDDRSPLGRRIRDWEVAARVRDRVLNDASASLDAQAREARLRRAAGLPADRPGKDPSPWLGEAGLLLVARWRAGLAVRAALLADPGTAASATLEQLRIVAGDRWPPVRAEALAVLVGD